MAALPLVILPPKNTQATHPNLTVWLTCAWDKLNLNSTFHYGISGCPNYKSITLRLQNFPRGAQAQLKLYAVQQSTRTEIDVTFLTKELIDEMKGLKTDIRAEIEQEAKNENPLLTKKGIEKQVKKRMERNRDARLIHDLRVPIDDISGEAEFYLGIIKKARYQSNKHSLGKFGGISFHFGVNLFVEGKIWCQAIDQKPRFINSSSWNDQISKRAKRERAKRDSHNSNNQQEKTKDNAEKRRRMSDKNASELPLAKCASVPFQEAEQIILLPNATNEPQPPLYKHATEQISSPQTCISYLELLLSMDASLLHADTIWNYNDSYPWFSLFHQDEQVFI